MPSKKRRRPTTPADSSAAQPKPFSLERYHLLPLELQHLIISFACLHPTPSTPSALTPFATDSATILNLCLVSRELRQQVQHRLYREISVVRPSKLYALQQALAERPDLGRGVERLHLGPQDILPPHWWPLKNAYAEGYSHESPGEEGCGGPFNWVSSSLATPCLPYGLREGAAWALNRPPKGCREAAILRAITSAQEALQEDLLDAKNGRPVNVDAVFQVQAALDLYLMNIRAMEDDSPHFLRLATRDTRVPDRCRSGKCGHYPALVLNLTYPPDGSSRKAEPSRKEVYSPSREQLLRHLSRPGSLTDRFDHPLLFNRSGFKIYVTLPHGKGHEDYDPAGARCKIRTASWHDVEGAHEAHKWQHLACVQLEDLSHTFLTGEKALNDALINTATFSSNLALARAVLALTPSLTNLSLTGFLEAAIGREGQSFPTVQRLSLGPAPVCWNGSSWYSGLEGVEDLRVAGAPLVAEELQEITSTMPRLRRIDWSLKEAVSGKMRLNMAQTIDLFLTAFGATVTAEHLSASPADQPLKSSKTGNDSNAANQAPTLTMPQQVADVPHERSGSSARLIVATLHPSDVAIVMASAPSEDIGAAWLKGQPVKVGVPRLHLCESTFTEAKSRGAPKTPSRDSASRVWGEFYKEGREWWAGGGAA